MDCVTCLIFQRLDDTAQRYAQEAFSSLAPWTQQAFEAFVGLWLAWVLFQLVIRGEGDWRELVLRGLGFAAIVGVLESSDFYFAWFYEPVRQATSGLTQMLVSVPSTGVSDTSFVALIERVETEMWKVVDFSFGVISATDMWNIHIFGIMLVFIIPFMFVWVIFLAFLLEGAFKLLGVTALGPVLVACAGFKPTRGFTMSAIRIALNGVMTVVFAGVAMGFTLVVLEEFIGLVPMDESGNLIVDADEFIFSLEFLGLFIVGLLSILFHLKAATMASNVSGAVDGPGAAAAVTGAGMAGLGTMAGIARRGFGGLRAGAAGAAKATAEAKLQSRMADGSSIKAQMLRRFLARR